MFIHTNSSKAYVFRMRQTKSNCFTSFFCFCFFSSGFDDFALGMKICQVMPSVHMKSTQFFNLEAYHAPKTSALWLALFFFGWILLITFLLSFDEITRNEQGERSAKKEVDRLLVRLLLTSSISVVFAHGSFGFCLRLIHQTFGVDDANRKQKLCDECRFFSISSSDGNEKAKVRWIFVFLLLLLLLLSLPLFRVGKTYAFYLYSVTQYMT